MEKGLSGAPSLAQGWAGSPESSSNPNQGSVLKEQTKSKTVSGLSSIAVLVGFSFCFAHLKKKKKPNRAGQSVSLKHKKLSKR